MPPGPRSGQRDAASFTSSARRRRRGVQKAFALLDPISRPPRKLLEDRGVAAPGSRSASQPINGVPLTVSAGADQPDASSRRSGARLGEHPRADPLCRALLDDRACYLADILRRLNHAPVPPPRGLWLPGKPHRLCPRRVRGEHPRRCCGRPIATWSPVLDQRRRALGQRVAEVLAVAVRLIGDGSACACGYTPHEIIALSTTRCLGTGTSCEWLLQIATSRSGPQGSGGPRDRRHAAASPPVPHVSAACAIGARPAVTLGPRRCSAARVEGQRGERDDDGPLESRRANDGRSVCQARPISDRRAGGRGRFEAVGMSPGGHARAARSAGGVLTVCVFVYVMFVSTGPESS